MGGKTVLVTGGAGFIGSNFVRLLLKERPDWKIINLDKLTYAGNLDNLREIENNPKYEFVKGDITDEKLVAGIMQKVDWVFHFAAESHVDRSLEGPYVFTKTNVLGTHILLEQAKRNGVKRFVHVSTDEVYGSIQQGAFKETDILNPSSPYSASKAASDLLALSYFHSWKFPVIVTRSSNNYGQYQHPEKVVPLFITNLLENKKVPLYGAGKNVRNWIYVEDNCEAILFVGEHGKEGEAYNIGGNQELENIQLTKTILLEMGKDESFIQYVKDRPGHDWRYSLDSSKLHKLGWKPKTDFQQGIRKTVQWYKDNAQWWKKVKEKDAAWFQKNYAGREISKP